MHYALLIHEPEAESYPEGEASPSWHAILDAHGQYGMQMGEAGVFVGGAGLKSATTATTVRVTPSGRTVHDGPFAETREQLGGLYMIDVPDLDAAIDWAKRLPIARNGSIEIRPMLPPPPQG
ncbi:YciI family protein [Brevundimonas subvibrioides]|uniref:YCII-related protein n=1 Tax=Brevundimonas subvibrioides (strain ATCC 15264 / DSM 4735 / LMG 14903 / NBRC 16000 / CB 81) TaxID=633149 RepID=D9QGJ9_BRESC|nr:YciI family protein [Brevundimonas subvibrioides]ADL00815.1 YCII-related protein [Brevundimonas subvibrioides ATCC 15264]